MEDGKALLVRGICAGNPLGQEDIGGFAVEPGDAFPVEVRQTARRIYRHLLAPAACSITRPSAPNQDCQDLKREEYAQQYQQLPHLDSATHLLTTPFWEHQLVFLHALNVPLIRQAGQRIRKPVHLLIEFRLI